MQAKISPSLVSAQSAVHQVQLGKGPVQKLLKFH